MLLPIAPGGGGRWNMDMMGKVKLGSLKIGGRGWETGMEDQTLGDAGLADRTSLYISSATVIIFLHCGFP